MPYNILKRFYTKTIHIIQSNVPEIFFLTIFLFLNIFTFGEENINELRGQVYKGFPFIYLYKDGLSESSLVYMPSYLILNVIIIVISLLLIKSRKKMKWKILVLLLIIVLSIFLYSFSHALHSFGCTGTSSMCNG